MLALLLVGSLAVSAPVPKVKKPPPDPERILGAWDVVENHANGANQPEGKVTVWTFTEGKMHSSSGNSTWTIKLDPDAAPKQIDITDYKGVYEFDGEKLKIAYTIGANRPTELKSGPNVYMVVLVKSKEQPGK